MSESSAFWGKCEQLGEAGMNQGSGTGKAVETGKTPGATQGRSVGLDSHRGVSMSERLKGKLVSDSGKPQTSTEEYEGFSWQRRPSRILLLC